ncbi:MAG TPA: hypothetical protein VGN63_19555 [Flavisolibacter sp.]|nr:hypothetical protein [Flavisolibacter sp.]
MDEEKILWKINYTNLNMYLATIPVFEPEENQPQKEKKAEKEYDDMSALEDFFKNA